MIITNQSFLSINQVQDQIRNTSGIRQSSVAAKTVNQEQGSSFEDIFNKVSQSNQEQTIKFSKHAAERLSDRNIELTQDQVERLNNGKIKAGEKGINESLILIDQLAFIVNVPNNTVVTAMDQNSNDSNIFTNIDGAVIA